MLIKRYNDFILESLELSEFMSDVINSLANKGNRVAKILRDNPYYEDDNEINYIDVGQDAQMISYLPPKKRSSSYFKEYKAKGRVEAKAGRVVRKILSDLIKNTVNASVALDYEGDIKFDSEYIYFPSNAFDIDEDSYELIDTIRQSPLVRVEYTITVESSKKEYVYHGTGVNFDVSFPSDYVFRKHGTNKMYSFKKEGDEPVVEYEYVSASSTDVNYIFSDGSKLRKDPDTLVKAKIKFSLKVDKSIPDSEIEKFANEYVAMMKVIKDASRSNLKEVSGDEIRKIYSGEGHAIADVGQLGGSCMIGKDKSYFDLYVKNDDVVSMLVMESDGKILGRALLWTLRDGNIFMDRVYTITDSDAVIFENYAIKKGYYYRNNSGNSDVKIYFNGKKSTKKLIVDLDNFKFKKYPYLDTLCYLNDEEGFLTNSDMEDYQKILRDTDGGYSSTHSPY